MSDKHNREGFSKKREEREGEGAAKGGERGGAEEAKGGEGEGDGERRKVSSQPC